MPWLIHPRQIVSQLACEGQGGPKCRIGVEFVALHYHNNALEIKFPIVPAAPEQGQAQA